MNNKYRIVKDKYLGFEVQVKIWWLPFWWYQCGGINTHHSIENAERYIDIHSENRKVVRIYEVEDATDDETYLDRIGAE